MPEVQLKERAKEIMNNLGPNTYKAAYEEGLSLSAYLNRQMPKDEYNDGLDGFSRLLKVEGLCARSIPEEGIYASRYEDFFRTPQRRALIPELCHRIWRRVANPPQTRALFTAQDSSVGSWENAWREAQMARWDQQLAPAIPLANLIALTTPIDSDAYRAFYLTHSATSERLVRVTEAADIPRMTLTGGDRTIRLYKYGRVLEASYEQLRRARMDKIAMIIARMAVQAEVDKVAAAIHYIVNGDGNASTTPTTHNLTTLDGDAVAGTLTLKGYIAFKMKFSNPYMLTVALVQEDVATDLLTLNAGSANIPMVHVNAQSGIGGFQAINPGMGDNVGLGWTSDAPANKILGVDARMALEHVTEIGSEIQEIERFTTNQTQTLTMTETNGFAVMDANASNILDINA